MPGERDRPQHDGPDGHRRRGTESPGDADRQKRHHDVAQKYDPERRGPICRNCTSVSVSEMLPTVEATLDEAARVVDVTQESE